MLNELKTQAKEFSELVQAHSTQNANTPRQIESRDQSVSTTPDLEYHSEPATRREIETKMSQIMSSKIKRLETESMARMAELNRTVELLTSQLQRALSDIKMREKEVELLKLTLLAERKASNERFDRMQVELNSKNQTLLTKLMNENDALKRELEEKTEIEFAERESVEILKKQWHDTETSLLKDIQNLKNVIGEFETEKSQIIKRLNRKYESAVKRGDNYRVSSVDEKHRQNILPMQIFFFLSQDYADAKEQHIISESARIREEYQNKLSKMQTKYLEKLESILKEKEKEVRTFHLNKLTK